MGSLLYSKFATYLLLLGRQAGQDLESRLLLPQNPLLSDALTMTHECGLNRSSVGG